MGLSGHLCINNLYIRLDLQVTLYIVLLWLIPAALKTTSENTQHLLCQRWRAEQFSKIPSRNHDNMIIIDSTRGESENCNCLTVNIIWRNLAASRFTSFAKPNFASVFLLVVLQSGLPSRIEFTNTQLLLRINCPITVSAKIIVLVLPKPQEKRLWVLKLHNY